MRLKGPKWKGNKRPSHEHIHARRKTWLSIGFSKDGKADSSPKLSSASWYDAPMYKEARVARWQR